MLKSFKIEDALCVDLLVTPDIQINTGSIVCPPVSLGPFRRALFSMLEPESD
jgi:hypothetical protein